jgi:putative acetyltransferase
LPIRRRKPEDHRNLVALWERSVRATHSFLTEEDIDFYRPLVVELLAGDALELWILADERDVPVGFLGMAGDSIEALFLDPSHIGRGGGRQLVEHAQELRGGTLTVDVNEQNDAARGFYEKLGFSVFARSALDGTGRPHPLLHMRRNASSDSSHTAHGVRLT